MCVSEVEQKTGDLEEELRKWVWVGIRGIHHMGVALATCLTNSVVNALASHKGYIGLIPSFSI